MILCLQELLKNFPSPHPQERSDRYETNPSWLWGNKGTKNQLYICSFGFRFQLKSPLSIDRFGSCLSDNNVYWAGSSDCGSASLRKGLSIYCWVFKFSGFEFLQVIQGNKSDLVTFKKIIACKRHRQTANKGLALAPVEGMEWRHQSSFLTALGFQGQRMK